MSEEDDRARYRYLQLKAKASASEDERLETGPDRTGNNQTGLQKVAGGITRVMQAIDQPGAFLGIKQPQVNEMSPQGDVLFNKAGEAITEYLGRRMDSPVVPALAGTAVSMMNPQNWMTRTLPGKTGLLGQEGFQRSAQEAGRKALGFTKRYLNKAPENIKKANVVAQAMLDQGVITNPLRHPFTSGGQEMLERAQDLGEQTGRTMGESITQLSEAGKTAFNTTDVIGEIESQLMPKYEGGAYNAEKAVVQEIIDTVKAHGEGPLTFSSAQALKEKLQEIGKFHMSTDATKTNLYRRASGVVRDALDRSVAKVGLEKSLPVMEPGAKTGDPHALFAFNENLGPGYPTTSKYQVFGDPSHPMIKAKGFGTQMTAAELEATGIPIVGRTPRSVGQWEPLESVGQANPELRQAATKYFTNKSLYGKSLEAEKAITNRVSSEQGNKNIGLTDTIVAGAELAAGNPLKAAATVGFKRAFERGYHATKATLADRLAKVSFTPVEKRIAGGVARGTTSVASESLNTQRRQSFMEQFVTRFIVGKQ